MPSTSDSTSQVCTQSRTHTAQFPCEVADVKNMLLAVSRLVHARATRCAHPEAGRPSDPPGSNQHGLLVCGDAKVRAMTAADIDVPSDDETVAIHELGIRANVLRQNACLVNQTTINGYERTHLLPRS